MYPTSGHGAADVALLTFVCVCVCVCVMPADDAVSVAAPEPHGGADPLA